MADYAIPKSGAAYIFYTSLVDQSNTKVFKSSPTLAAGDFKVSIDGGAFANLATLPTNTPGGVLVKLSLSAGEMTGDNIAVAMIDAAGAEWCDQLVNIQTAPKGINDLATPTNITAGTITTVTTVGTLTTYTGNTPQTGDSFARLGVAGVGLTNLGDTRIANLDAAVTSRMATYTQPTGFLAATFPTGTIASTTNITAGTITTVSTVTGGATAANQTTIITHLTDIKGATFSGATDSLEAIRDRGDVAWITGGAGLDAAGVRVAVGLASANLDTQLSTIDDFLDTEIAAIKAKTDLIPAAPAAVGDIPTANQNADALLDRANGIETSLTPRGAFRLIAAASAGKLSGAATTTAVIRNVGDTKDRITATVDADGNRTAITTDAT